MRSTCLRTYNCPLLLTTALGFWGNCFNLGCGDGDFESRFSKAKSFRASFVKRRYPPATVLLPSYCVPSFGSRPGQSCQSCFATIPNSKFDCCSLQQKGLTTAHRSYSRLELAGHRPWTYNCPLGLTTALKLPGQQLESLEVVMVVPKGLFMF